MGQASILALPAAGAKTSGAWMLVIGPGRVTERSGTTIQAA